MTIRQASAADHEAIWAILAPIFAAGETYAIARDITKEAALALWTEQPRATYVLEEGGEVLGTFYIKTNAAGGGAHVCNCGYATAEAARGRGIAQQMCEASQEAALSLGYKAMQFNMVLESNAVAVALWHRLGFETVGRLPKVFEHPREGLVGAHVMYKWLAD